jgi:hypothetical protein
VEPDQAAYQHAKASFEQQPWRNFPGRQGWDGYWFETESRLELFFTPNRRPAREFDLRGTGAIEVAVSFFERASQQRVLTSDQWACNVELSQQARLLQVISHADLKKVALRVVQVGGSARVQLGANGGPTPRIDIDAHASTEIELSGVNSSLVGSDHSWEKIVAINAGISVDPRVQIQTLHLIGECRALSSTLARVKRLVVDPGASIAGDRERGIAQIHCGSIELAPDADFRKEFTVGSKCELSAETAAELSVAIAPASTFCMKDGTNLRVSGSGKLRIEASADGVWFLDAGMNDPPQLEMSPWAIVRRASGTVRLGDVRHAEISGPPKGDGLTVHSILRQADGVEALTEGVLIRDFQVPVERAGLQTIRMLADTAAVAVPIIHSGLPGSWKEPLRDVTPHFRSDYARAMAQLGESGGAPGSVVTKLTQLEYRMRRKTAKGPIEKATLWAYSSLGYGERAAPALVTYVALAVILSALALYGGGHTEFDLSWSELKGFGKSVIDWLITPLHVLRLGSQEGQAATGNDLEFLGRVFVAVPFVTGIVALRKYVKRTRER